MAKTVKPKATPVEQRAPAVASKTLGDQPLPLPQPNFVLHIGAHAIAGMPDGSIVSGPAESWNLDGLTRVNVRGFVRR